jgi:hypothetical protein
LPRALTTFTKEIENERLFALQRRSSWRTTWFIWQTRWENDSKPWD